jgi:mannose-6-phosphate isomerase-like protein (cupin superfamily)
MRAGEPDRSERSMPYALAAGEGVPARAPEGSRMLVKAGIAETGGLFGLLEGIDRAGFSTVVHRHHVAESWYVLDGVYRYYLDGRWLEVGPGGFVFVPAGVAHGLRCVEAGRKLTLFVPGGTEGFFRDVHAALETGELAMDATSDIGRRYGIDVLGPLPQEGE